MFPEIVVSGVFMSVCASTQLFRFLTGRDEQTADLVIIAALDQAYQADPSFQQLLLALVASLAITRWKGE